MDASAIIAFTAFCSTLGGIALKKSWLLWLAIPLFFLLFLYWAYIETWFVPTAQHSIIYLSIGTTIALAFTAIRMQSKPSHAPSEGDTLDDADDDMTVYRKEQEEWDRTSNLYRTKRKRRS
jgi:hypothetical protein